MVVLPIQNRDFDTVAISERLGSVQPDESSSDDEYLGRRFATLPGLDLSHSCSGFHQALLPSSTMPSVLS